MVCPAALFSAKIDGNPLQPLCMSARPANEQNGLHPLKPLLFSVFEKKNPQIVCSNFNSRGWKCKNIVEGTGTTRCQKCYKSRVRSEERNWATSMVGDSRVSDDNRVKKYKGKPLLQTWANAYWKKIDRKRYITVKFLKDLAETVNYRCHWCGVEMQLKNRMATDGLTVERLWSGPHYQDYCTLACMSCNRVSYHGSFGVFPKKIAKYCFIKQPTHLPGKRQVHLKRLLLLEVLQQSLAESNRSRSTDIRDLLRS